MKLQRPLERAWPALALLGAAACYFVWSRAVVAVWTPDPIPLPWFAGRWGFEGYARWDTGWYFRIIEWGYNYEGPGRQSAVAFFPGYPAAVRAASFVIGNSRLAAIALTIGAASSYALLVRRWAESFFTTRTARLTVIGVLSWPYAYYLFGVIYSDALFLMLALGAFVLLERDHPWLATLAGALATATRPVGVAVAAGLLIRALERDGVLVTRWTPGVTTPPRFARVQIRAVRPATIAPAFSLAGLGAYCLYLWRTFDAPFAFTAVGSAPGWSRHIDLETIFKFGYVDVVRKGDVSVHLATLTLSGIIGIAALLSIPLVLRRLGAGYAVFALIAVGLPFASSPEFMGMGRYVLAAFPCIAVAADALSHRRSLARIALGTSTLLLLVMSALFVHGYYIS